ncbi:MAG: tRNA pseudouridine(55) synthase TruB [Olsenella sp.]
MKRGQSGLNLLLAVDKPEGITSHDAVSKVRYALGERRVGHAGTLDPAASGLLVIGVGQGTRLMGMLTQDQKSYEARISFGRETDTDDREGKTVREAEVPKRLFDEEEARLALAGLVGVQDQVPPAYSAISIDGKRAYALAREGEAVELASRRIEIYQALLLAVGEDDEGLFWDCAFMVSKGTYIRSIARDLGRSLGSAAHLGALRRLSSGNLTLKNAHALEEIAEAGADGILSLAADPVRALGLPKRAVTDSELEKLLQGKTLPLGSVDLKEGERCAMALSGKVYGVWECVNDRLKTVANFPAGISGVR